MNLKQVSNEDLISNLKNLVKTERRVGVEILHHLKEVERRDLHLKLGYSSLFIYMVEELKYAEGSANRRIAALRLLNSIPVMEAKKVEEKINAGVMSLTTVAMVQDLVCHKKKENEPMTVGDKLETLKSIEGLSKKQTEAVLIAKAPEAFTHKEKVRPVTSDLTELKILAHSKLMAKLKRIKELRSHKNVNPTYGELLEDMADLVLKKLDPINDSITVDECSNATNKNIDERKSVNPAFLEKLISNKTTASIKSTQILTSMGAPGGAASRYIPAYIRKEVWSRDRGKCTYTNPHTNKTCGSTHLIQFEHVMPFALGGEHTLQNLTLHCANHNQLNMREEFNFSRKVGAY